MSPVGFLHTSPVHITTFNELLFHVDHRRESVVVVDEGLLRGARAFGPSDPRVIDGIEAALDELESAGVSAVLCTCSTIAGVAEAIGQTRKVPVVRVDRAMAAAAVRRGPRIAVVATVESTLTPTRQLIESVALEQGAIVELTSVVSEGAWERFEAGAIDDYLDLVAATCETLEDRCDVIVLAQASMAAAADRVSGAVPILSSPKLAVEDADEIAGNPEAEEALFHLHNLTLAEGHSLLLTAQNAPNFWPLTLPDLASRMQATTLAHLRAPDDALLAALLMKLFADRQLSPNPEILPYLARRMDRSFDAARRLVATLDETALTAGRPITRAMAAKVLDKMTQ